ncbi:plasmid maintenance system antidote protein, XRE family [Bosea lathyri]|uniref:Plasmid maintenance system antidote protein, XRE family n=2 Tax=Bosea lathyri TaxID=1036778 RepID=A0A1H5TME9_9HYPH|nr:plasmid maintenance system antidote protein, XRE family [Bosea lathyri]
MRPLELSAYAVAKACGTPRTRIERIAREETGITADTALRLGKLFGTSAEFWLGLQDDYDLETARASLSDAIARIRPVAA